MMRSPLARIFCGVAVVACLSLPLPGSGFGAPARAATWVEVGVATNGVRALVDTDTIDRRGGSVRVAQRFILPPGSTRRLAYVDQQVVYACSSGVVSTIRSVEHDPAGRVLCTEGSSQNRPYKVMAGTLPHFILEVLC
jgi:hypothetical protein